jgi:transcription initiation factor TFIIE subunit alpha
MDPTSLAKVFVKTAVRMFYETEHIVVIDALVYHGALSLQDLVIVLDWGKNQKGAAKLTGKLREGGLISVYACS